MPSRRRWVRTAAPVGLVALLSCSAVGCTTAAGDVGVAGSGTAGSSASSSSDAGQDAPAATLAGSTKAVEIIAGGSPGEVSLATSRAVFATAPVVVVAQAGDEAQERDGSARAARLGVPLLLVDNDGKTGSGAPSPTPSTPPTPGASSTSAAAPAPLAPALSAEVARLGARAVFATSPVLARRLGALPNVQVVTEPGALPHVAPGSADSALTVLVRKGDDESGSAAVAASAAAAGASVVPVVGADPRADPDAIRALAKSVPKRVLAVGDAFGPVPRLTARLRVAGAPTVGCRLVPPGCRVPTRRVS